MSQIYKTPPVMLSNSLVVSSSISYPYNVNSGDSFIPVDTSMPRTINLMENPEKGFRLILKDSNGLSDLNHITINSNGKTIDGEESYTIQNSYGSLILIYNGTEWNVI